MHISLLALGGDSQNKCCFIYNLVFMEVECINLPRMAASMFSLLLFMQLSRFFASGLEVKSKICGADHIAYSNLYGHELLYLNGNLVDKVLFCKALRLHYADDCVFEGYTGTDYCGLDLSLGMHCNT